MSRIIYSDVLFVHPNWESSHIFISFFGSDIFKKNSFLLYLLSTILYSDDNSCLTVFWHFYFWTLLFLYLSIRVPFHTFLLLSDFLSYSVPCSIFHVPCISILGFFSHILFGEWFSVFLCLETYCLPSRGGRGTSCSPTSRWNILYIGYLMWGYCNIWYQDIVVSKISILWCSINYFNFQCSNFVEYDGLVLSGLL